METQSTVATPAAGTTTNTGTTAPSTTETKVETPVVETPAQVAEKARARDFAILSRQQKAVRDQEKAFKAEQAAFKAEREAAKAKEQRLAELKKTNPVLAVEEGLGLSFEDLQSYILAGGKITPELENKAIKEELAKVKEQQESFQKSRQEEAAAAKAAEEAQAVRSYFDGAVKFIKDAGEKYELTNADNAYNMVEQVIQAHANKTFEETGNAEVLTYEQAADAVEKYLEEQYSAKYKVFSSTKKGQKILSPPQEETKQSGSVPANRTISNSMTARSLPAVRGMSKGKMSETQRIAELAAKYNTK